MSYRAMKIIKANPVLTILWSSTLFLFIILFKLVFLSLIDQWSHDDNFSYCFLIPLVSGWIIWTERKIFIEEKNKVSLIGFLIIIFGIICLVFGSLGGIEILQRLALVIVIFGIVLFNFGIWVFKQLVFPLLCLFFMIPLPITIQGSITFPLQIFSTTAAKVILHSIHIPVLQSGNILRLPTGSLEVVEACSGVRSLFSYLAFAVLVAYLQKRKPINQMIIILSAIPFALCANALRIAVSGFLGAIYGLNIARGFLHDVSGVVLSGFGILIFLLEAKILNQVFHGKPD